MGKPNMNEENKKYLWQLYAQVYDAVMLRFLPYRQLIINVTRSLNPQDGWHILDAGCGTGNFLYNLIRVHSGIKVVGVDFSPAMLRRASFKVKENDLNNQKVILQEVNLNHPIPFPEDDFQGVICVNVLYAVDNPTFLLGEIYRVLRKGGKMILVTPPFQPKMGPVFKEHVYQLRERAPLWWPVILTGQIVYLIPFLIVFLLINYFIKDQQSFHFLNGEELSFMLKSCGFELISMERVYGGQDWFLEAVKPFSKGA
jgi:ubiquinone/menaquinone biosynthesis C-methylase UbiE